ncbi:RNA polymerase sigma factor [Chloroflexota bacterium]
MLDRNNSEWIETLSGPDPGEAINDLRITLIRGLRFALSNRVQGDLDMLVEDFAQDALMRILDKLDTFRGESRFTTWAQKIAVRVAFSELRRQRWKDISLQDLMPANEDYGDFTPAILSDPGPTPEQRTTQQSMIDMVMRLIKEELTDRQREAIMAVMVAGMPLEEVARRMNTNRNALYKLIHDARKRLQTRLANEGLTPDEVLEVFETG